MLKDRLWRLEVNFGMVRLLNIRRVEMKLKRFGKVRFWRFLLILYFEGL